MVTIGDTAPTFTLPKAGGDAYNDVSEFSLSDALGDAPVILAFYPAAFTSGCTAEMCAFRDSMDAFDALEASVYGISVDLPFAQNIWIQQEGLNFPMLSDWNHDVIHQYDVVRSDLYGSIEAAQRSIFVIGADGTVADKWIRTGENPNFEALIDRVLENVETIA